MVCSVRARMCAATEGILAAVAACLGRATLCSCQTPDSLDTWSTGRCREKLSHGDRELHLADLLPLPFLYENGLSEQLVRQKCLPVSQCGWYCDPPPVHAEPGSKRGGGRGQFHLLPNPLSSCLFCLSVWADFSLLFFLLHLQHFPPTLFSHKRGGRQADTYRVVLFLFIYYFGCWRCLPRGSLQLLSCAGGRRGWLLSAVLGAQRLIGNTMRDSAQKRLWDGQISQSHFSTSRGARNVPCWGAPRSLAAPWSADVSQPIHTCTVCVHDLPQEKVRQCWTKDHWSHWASWVIPRQAVPWSPAQQPPREPHPR